MLKLKLHLNFAARGLICRLLFGLEWQQKSRPASQPERRSLAFLSSGLIVFAIIIISANTRYQPINPANTPP